MTIDRRQFMRLASAAATVVSAAPPARAEMLDMAQITIGFPPGATSDFVARLVAEKLRGVYATNIIIDNRGGAGGQLAASTVKAGKTDGSSVLMTPMPIMSVYPYTYRKLPYDPVADFAPVSRGVVYDRTFSVGAAVPESVRTIPEFAAWAKGDPSRTTFGSPAAGSPLHFTGLLIGRALGVQMVHVPYRGSAAALPDLFAGRLPAFVSPLGDVWRHRGEGKLRLLGTSGDRRSPFTPEVATFAEQGLRGIGVPEGFSFFLPAKAPPNVVARLNAALVQVLRMPEVADALKDVCMVPESSTPAALGAELDTSMKYWSRVVQSIGFTPES